MRVPANAGQQSPARRNTEQLLTDDRQETRAHARWQRAGLRASGNGAQSSNLPCDSRTAAAEAFTIGDAFIAATSDQIDRPS
jgi:hypothetical protein